jgi:hypothetical protein
MILDSLYGFFVNHKDPSIGQPLSYPDACSDSNQTNSFPVRTNTQKLGCVKHAFMRWLLWLFATCLADLSRPTTLSCRGCICNSHYFREVACDAPSGQLTCNENPVLSSTRLETAFVPSAPILLPTFPFLNFVRTLINGRKPVLCSTRWETGPLCHPSSGPRDALPLCEPPRRRWPPSNLQRGSATR